MHVESAKKSFSHSKEESEITATLLGNSEAPLFKLAISDFKNPDSSLLFFTISLAMIPTYSSKNSQRLLKKSTRSQIARKSISHFPKKLQLEDMKRRKKRLKTQEIRFIDSFRFMGSLLERLVENLSEEHFIYPKRSFGEKWKIFSRKGVYPYDWMDSFEKFEASLPCKDDFFSLLYGEHISNEDLCHAQQVWQEFDMKNMGDYHDLI